VRVFMASRMLENSSQDRMLGLHGWVLFLRLVPTTFPGVARQTRVTQGCRSVGAVASKPDFPLCTHTHMGGGGGGGGDGVQSYLNVYFR
jgi:hypothetical protein